MKLDGKLPPLLLMDGENVLARTLPLWEDLRGGRLFLAGGTGFFGCGLLETFLVANERLNLGARVTILARDFDKFARRTPHLSSRPEFDFLSGDVRDFSAPHGAFTHLIHAATDSTLPLNAQNADEVLDTAVNGTRRLLQFAERSGVRRLLLASSGAVYGAQPPTLSRVPEDHSGAPSPLDPLASYAEGKRAAELLWARAAALGMGATVARGFAFVGPHLPLDAHFAIGNFIRDAMAGRPIEVRGDGSPVRSYLYAADLAAWLWTMLFRGEAGRAYNVGSERFVSVRELAHLVAFTVNPDVPVRVAQAPRPEVPIHRYVPSTARARQELGLEETLSLEDAIRRTVSYHRTPVKESLHA